MIRMILLFNFQQGLTRRQYIFPLNRAREFELHKMRSERKQQELLLQSETREVDNSEEVLDVKHDADDKAVEQFEMEFNSFTLPSSGRMIRNIDTAPPKSKRLWITPIQTVRLRRFLQVKIPAIFISY